MDKKTWLFVLLALLLSLLLAIVISPFASSSPDGLEKVAEDKGFLEKAEEQEAAWELAPIPDYAVGGIENESLATALAGLIGTLLTFAVGLG
ncbi:MAG: PDGLE domain-containing protein, partial [Desulfobacteraceae bacterium]|nr:PDGLE domain-containing protein [Desulfobacteraceae bacterium]